MITVNQPITLYTFEELSDNAKYTVQDTNWEVIGDDIALCVDEELNERFTAGHIPEYQFDLSCCQGSGFNLYGNIWLDDLFKLAGIPTPDEVYDKTIELKANQRYTYSMWSRHYYGEDIRDFLSEYMSPDDAQSYSISICAAMSELCAELYKNAEECADYYLTPEAYEDELFTVNGQFYGYAWDVEWHDELVQQS